MAKLLDLSVYGPGHISNILQVDASVYAKAFVTDGGEDTQVVRGDGTLASISSLSVSNADKLDNYHESDFFRYRGPLYQKHDYDANTLGIGEYIFRNPAYGNVGTGANHVNALNENSTIQVFKCLQMSAAAWSDSMSYRLSWGNETNSQRPNRWSPWITFISSNNYTDYVNTTNFPGLNKVGTVTSVTVTGANGLSGTGTVTSSGTITLSNSGVRSVSINSNYLRVNTNGTNNDLTIPYANNTDKLDGFHENDFSRHIEGITGPGSKGYYKIGSLPASSNGTYDAFLIQGEIGSWDSKNKAVLNVCVSRRAGVTFCGYTQGLWNRNLGIDIGINDAGEIVLIVTGLYTSWTLNLHTIQGTISYTGTTFTPADTNFVLLSASNNVSKSLADGTVEKTTKLTTPRTIWGQSFDGTGNVSGAISGATTISFTGSLDHNSHGVLITEGPSSWPYRNILSTGWNNAVQDYTDIGTAGANNNTGVIRIIANGNVGIGTPSPSYKLHVVGDIYTTTGFKKNGSSDLYVLLGGGGHKLLSDFSMAHSHPYLPTAGGTMTGDITMSGMNTNLNWNVDYLAGWARDFIVYNQHNSSSGDLVNVFHLSGYGSENGFEYAYIGTSNYLGNNLRFNKDGSITIGSGTIWHSNNDGSGSGLDADLLDGIHASDFATASHTHPYLPLSGGTLSGGITFKYGANTTDQLIQFSSTDSSDTQTVYLGIRRPLSSFGPCYKDNNGNWYDLIHSGNYTTYTVKKDGTGASGTWGINITGTSLGLGSYLLDMTKNTGDTWVPVYNGNKLQYRVIPAAYNNDPSTLSVNYANYAGNADTVDNKHASDFILSTDFSSKELTSNLITISKTLTVTEEWMDTGIKYTDLTTGTYVVQVYSNTNDNLIWYGYWSGIMTWYGEFTNASESDEILLHRGAHAYNGNTIYLRTINTASWDGRHMRLQIAANKNFASATYVFKFKKLI